MKKIDVGTLLALYRGVKQRSLRLETRQTYGVPWEDEGLAAWRRGEPQPPSPAMERHWETTRELVASGRHDVRVRFVELPMTEYSRHEFEVAYPANSAAGEEIYLVDRAQHPEFDHVREDFVVFDDTSVMWYRYTDDDQLTGYDLTEDPVLVRDCLALAEEVLAVAVPFAEFSAGPR